MNVSNARAKWSENKGVSLETVFLGSPLTPTLPTSSAKGCFDGVLYFP